MSHEVPPSGAIVVAARGMEVRRVRLGALHHDPSNVRTHDERNIRLVVSSLHEHGQVEPLVVQAGTGRVIGGNARLEAMRRLGWTECDITEVAVDDVTARALALKLNRTAELASWDATLADALAELDEGGFDLATLGWDPAEADGLFAARSDADSPASGWPPR